jgi:hypothetical protein
MTADDLVAVLEELTDGHSVRTLITDELFSDLSDAGLATLVQFVAGTRPPVYRPATYRDYDDGEAVVATSVVPMLTAPPFEDDEEELAQVGSPPQVDLQGIALY